MILHASSSVDPAPANDAKDSTTCGVSLGKGQPGAAKGGDGLTRHPEGEGKTDLPFSKAAKYASTTASNPGSAMQVAERFAAWERGWDENHLFFVHFRRAGSEKFEVE